MPEFKNRVGHALKVAMAKADMSTSDLAERSGVSVDAIRLYLRGDVGPQFETAYRLAQALGCTPNDLCGFGE